MERLADYGFNSIATAGAWPVIEICRLAANKARPPIYGRQGHSKGRSSMSRKVTRRKFMAGTAAGAAAATFNFPAPAISQAAPFKLGLLTVKTGPLAQGGIQMELGIVTFLKEKNYKFACRKVKFIY